MTQVENPEETGRQIRAGARPPAGWLYTAARRLVAVLALVGGIEAERAKAAEYTTAEATAAYQLECRKRRAGYPDRVAPYARCTYGRDYCGQYVGGGAATIGRRLSLHSEPRYPDEGTFGIDYAPPWSCVNLMWYHGKKYQGGEGQYQPNRINNPFPNCFRR